MKKINPNTIRLKADTIMHNNYTEGMPEMLQEIVLYHIFEDPTSIKVEVDHDGN
jgi:hypothetical protein